MSDNTLQKDDRKEPPSRGVLSSLLKGLRRKNDNEAIREKIEELIDAPATVEENPQASSERQLLSNILKVRDRKVRDLMVPRADIVAVEAEISLADLLGQIALEGHSRMPVYRADLDDIIGMVHIKDLLPFANRPQDFNLQQVVRDVIIVAPTMPVLDLLVEMRQSRRHMAMVVDEYGGIDGLVTIEDLVEEIVGDIEDEHDESEAPQLTLKPDGSVMADGRLDLDELEKHTGPLLDEDTHDTVDTLGGLLFFLAGRVPGRGEVVKHDNGIEFEVVEADARRVKRVRIRNLPSKPESQG